VITPLEQVRSRNGWFTGFVPSATRRFVDGVSRSGAAPVVAKQLGSSLRTIDVESLIPRRAKAAAPL
jgi:hypothetical protein